MSGKDKNSFSQAQIIAWDLRGWLNYANIYLYNSHLGIISPADDKAACFQTET
jgi:hypothetical protein